MTKGNLPIPELQPNEEVWLVLVVTSIRQGTTKQRKRYYEAQGRNPTGAITLKIWPETRDAWGVLTPGLWGVVGRLETYQNMSQFIVKEYRPVDLNLYCDQHGCEPVFPKAYTIDIETLALPGYRERVPYKLKKSLESGEMRLEQQERYVENPQGEAERVYMLGSFYATSGRILSIAVHVGLVPDVQIEGLESADSEYVFGIDEEGNEIEEAAALAEFMDLMSGFEPEFDELVGHNILNFDLPFIYQRCLVNNVPVPLLFNLADYQIHGVYDTMHHWWLGAKRRVGLDDLAWALGIESSKTGDVEGSRIHEFYYSATTEEERKDALLKIREYNLNDVRATRKIYERMVGVFGR